MPITPIIDPAAYDPAAIVVPIEELRRAFPQRGNFEQLDGLLALDLERQLAVGVLQVPADPFWAADHMPGRPLLPGVLMLDALAQLGGYFTYAAGDTRDGRLFGWSGLESVTFRRPVLPGQTVMYATVCLEMRSRRARFHGQGFVDGHCVVDAIVVGMPIAAAAAGGG
jgi:3-hydroxyacyl-[acyl-carrier-protein] dehydratase